MYYNSIVEGVVRVDPKLFAEKLSDAIFKQLKLDYVGIATEELGKVVAIIGVNKIGEGIIVPGDGAAYYTTKFSVIHYQPEINELIEGEIKDITKFGGFINFGAFEGMVHISQTMDDFVSLSKQGTLLGKDSKKVLKVGDRVRARIIAVSMKDMDNPKIGLTMRQPYLGKMEWLEDIRKEEEKDSKAVAVEKK